MSRTCESCGRSWRGSATFCGRCGDLLPDALGATVARRPGDAGTTPHGRLLVVLLGLVVLGGAATVPSLSIERTPPVTGDIGVPETDDLQAAPAQVPRRRTAPSPDVSCSRAGAPVQCLVWERDLLGPADPEGWQGWPMASGGHVLLAGGDGLEGVDARTGTRLWRHADQAFPRDTAGDAVLVERPSGGLQVLDVATGAVRWQTTDAGGAVQGDALHGDLVLGLEARDGPTLVAHDLQDGAPRWDWPLPWPWAQAMGVPGDRLVVSPAGDEPGMAVLDLRTGAEIAISDVRTSWWMLGVVGDTLVLAEPVEGDPDGNGNPAGDGGGVLRGVSLEDALVRWERPVPAAQVMFGLAGGVVLAPSTGLLTAIDAATGDVAWTRDLGSAEEVGFHGPGVFTGTPDWSRVPQVVAVRDHTDEVVRGLDPATGDVRWEHPLEVAALHVGVGEETVWVGVVDGFLMLDPATGREVVRVHGTGMNPFALEPLLLFHHESGTVARIDPDAEGPR